jgi:hypothetical protein
MRRQAEQELEAATEATDVNAAAKAHAGQGGAEGARGRGSADNLPATRRQACGSPPSFYSEFGTELVRHPFGSQLWRGFRSPPLGLKGLHLEAPPPEPAG